MPQIYILTPDPENPSFHGRWRAVLTAYQARLSGLGLEIKTPAWTACYAGPDDLVLPLLAWGYHRTPDLWFQTLKTWQERGLKILNPTSVLAWNTHKSYLLELQNMGVPVVPSRISQNLTPQDVVAARAAFGTPDLVIKPCISAGSRDTLVLKDGEGERHEDLAQGPKGDALLQPFLPAVQDEGEWSLIFFAGEFSHAVLKTPKSGDFRSQPEYQSHVRAVDPPSYVMKAAHLALLNTPEPCLYARIDLVRDLFGQPALMEMELIEPDLYLPYADLAGAKFAMSVRDMLVKV